MSPYYHFTVCKICSDFASHSWHWYYVYFLFFPGQTDYGFFSLIDLKKPSFGLINFLYCLFSTFYFCFDVYYFMPAFYLGLISFTLLVSYGRNEFIDLRSFFFSNIGAWWYKFLPKRNISQILICYVSIFIQLK